MTSGWNQASRTLALVIFMSWPSNLCIPISAQTLVTHSISTAANAFLRPMQPSDKHEDWTNPRVCHPNAARKATVSFCGRISARSGELERLLGLADAAVEQGSTSRIPLKIAKSVRKSAKKSGFLVPEFRRDHDLISHDVSALSSTFREGKAGAILVDCTGDDGDADVLSFLSEQKSSMGNFPGPCPVFQRGRTSSMIEVAEACARGVQGVFIPAQDDSRQEELCAMIQGAHAMGLEVVVEASSVQDVEHAVAAAAQMVCVRGTDVKAAVQMLDALPDHVGVLGAIPAMQPECREVDQALLMRAAGFHGIVLADCARDADKDQDYAEWALQTLRSKRSETFSFITMGVQGDVKEATFEEKWDGVSAVRDPTAWAKWKKYKKTRDYQIRAQVWGA